MDIKKELFRPGRRVILDSDAFNEADDQFAIAYAALNPNIELSAVLAAPYTHGEEGFPEKGTALSYEEIGRVLSLAGRKIPYFMGSRSFMCNTQTPVESPAADFLIRSAMSLPEEERLIVCAIGAGTNIASALLKCPELADRLIILWQAGNAPETGATGEYNMRGDICAAQVIFASPAPLVQIPAYNTASKLYVTVGELRRRTAGKNKLCDYLYSQLCRYIGAAGDGSDDEAGKIIWDIGIVGLVCSGLGILEERERPVITEDGGYAGCGGNGTFLYCPDLDRNAVFEDMYRCITAERLGI